MPADFHRCLEHVRGVVVRPLPKIKWLLWMRGDQKCWSCDRIQYGPPRYFLIDADRDADTWAYFETKQINSYLQYEWNKTNIFVRWLPQTKQTIIAAFDERPSGKDRTRKMFQRPDPVCLVDPFWVYTHVLTELTQLEDSAVWAVRDEVRATEKEPMPIGRPQPEYRRLHDIARHTIHVSETLDVAARTISGIILEHDSFMRSDLVDVDDKDISHDIQRRLRFLENMIASLRHRSTSNEKRLVNEIQLAFNNVAQHDAGVSVEMGRAMKTDSAAMKTVSIVTLIFLPPTFVSAVFSMSFFNYSADSGWAMSDQIWIYWAFALPLTLVSVIFWYCWQNLFGLGERE
ncbi:hypothetical protein VP1G_08713 [Cytospora mali]|uniref:Magnesium transport protein CorA n=1 Tax=Cytospora mali TaxID=578113 RepID=A0A194VCE6_CYTMA|nr:hypothetical protein VP1G_08713 [Valsa mali var. pyri (nom. inval.)]